MSVNIQSIKQRFGIIGNSSGLIRAINIAYQVAPTDLSVLINGESGVGKENFPKIIHQFSPRKHGAYIAVNCGAIPEGTIDSELFGHEKGAFTGATESRKGYFEVANGGTIFLDEVGELPLPSQVRLLRVLETGEFIRVGSSKVQKTDVRVVAATNINIQKAISENKFREDLFYRLNTVPILVPPLRERGEDILLLFRKFAQDTAEKYRMPSVKLTHDAQHMIVNYRWPGNIRQLKNVAEQLSVIEQDREIDMDSIVKYLPSINQSANLPAIYNEKSVDEKTFASEREILYKILFDMRSDMTDLKKLVAEILEKSDHDIEINEENAGIIKKLYKKEDIIPSVIKHRIPQQNISYDMPDDSDDYQDTEAIIEESLSIEDKEKELIIKALEKHGGKRKLAALELGISERTLYRKIKELNL
ncbi:MAG: sigma 54-interacting transcriptional regulator [Bacteroidales bacterium]|nr:sigma 54-interacting transcriptional regulator [Bacteroidales bacterium]